MSEMCQITTPIGDLILTGSGEGISEIRFGHATTSEAQMCCSDLLGPAAEEIREYFSGQRLSFSMKLDLGNLSPFARRVIAALLLVPPGETISYGELAARAGSPKAARAVGRVMARNRIPLVIPCHRVVGRHAEMTGYSGGEGIATKEWLLDFERSLVCRS